MKVTRRSKKYNGVFEYQNSKGKFWGYRLKYYNRFEKRREKKQLSFQSEREAFEAMVDMQNNINKENFHKVNPTKITLGEFSDMIIAQNKPNKNDSGIWSYNTYYQYRTLRRNWLPDTIAHIKIKDLTLELYQSAFINYYKDDTPPSTLISYHNKVNALMNEAVKRDYISNNRIRFAVLPQTNKEQEDKFLTIEQLNALLENSHKLKQHFHVMIHLLAYTGMRIGELRVLNWSDINFNDRTLNISKSIDQDNRVGPTKGRNRRIIDVNKDVMIMLKDLKKVKISKGRFRNNNDFVFISRKMINPITAVTMQNVIKQLATDTISKRISSHYFRHTHASILLMSGQSTKAVANRLGNTEKTIIDYYSHFIPGITVNASDAFEEKLKNGAKTGANSEINTNIVPLND